MVKVLVVEDAPAVRLAVVDALEALGLEVTEAENGRLALAELERAALERPAPNRNAYDLVVTDVLMPEMDGVELIKTMRTRYPAVKVLAMSGGAPNLPAGYVLKMTEMFDADAVLYKPFTNEELRGTVARLVALPAGV